MKTPENDKTPYDLIARYLSGDASSDEIIDVERWKSASAENLKVFEQCKNVWEKTGQANLFTDIDINKEWDHFLRGVEPGLKVDGENRSQVSYNIYKIAAVIVVGLIFGFAILFLNNSGIQEFYTENSIDKLELPDGSIVHLNKHSKITFSKSFLSSREVKLDGEAFFDVVRDTSNAFIISTGKVRVKVLGTSFNVDAYRSEDIVNVTVASGKVAVYDKKELEKQNVLVKGEKIDFSRELHSGKVSNNHDLNFLSWKTGVMSFENSSLEEVLNKLEELYGIEFELANKELYRCRISVKFDNSELDYILNTLSLTLGFSFEKTNTSYLVSGAGC